VDPELTTPLNGDILLFPLEKAECPHLSKKHNLPIFLDGEATADDIASTHGQNSASIGWWDLLSRDQPRQSAGHSFSQQFRLLDFHCINGTCLQKNPDAGSELLFDAEPLSLRSLAA